MSWRASWQIGFVSLFCYRLPAWAEQWMRLQPQHAGGGSRINPGFVPPSGFVATAMHLAMMSAAERDCELIADLTAECRQLRKSQVMRVCRAPAADQARLLGHGLHMLPVANPTRQRQDQNRFVDRGLPISSSSAS
jgi:hypothetical protein